MSDGQHQYLYLVRLAWNLRQLGMGPLVEVLMRGQPAVVIPQASVRGKITTVRRDGSWFHAWRPGRKQSARVGTVSVCHGGPV